MSIDSLRASLADRYTIERELGAGGMATVYLAEDLKHQRKVAIKVLRPELAAVIGAERFLVEIRTTANLQHPHILPLHDSGEADGALFYVMPYIEGVSLRDRITREHQLPVEEAIRIASEVADALEYAHQRGIIHRDIKPENILLQGGHALVADFGIALAASKAGGRMTETGMSLGTPQYMSPEQAMGEREITPASDVYALGAVTYEMLTGEAPFTGPTAQAIVAKVMTSEPVEITSLRKTVPSHVADAVHAALQKLPADRFTSARQFAEALQGRSTLAVPRASSRTSASRQAPAPRSRRVALWLAAAGAWAIAIATWLGLHQPASSPPTPVQFVVTAKGTAEPVLTLGWGATVSPDGRTIVYAGVSGTGVYQYYAREVGHLESRPIPGTTGAVEPLFSPDGKWLAFQAGDGRLEKVDLVGGAPIPLATYAGGNGIAWSSRGTLVTGAGGAWLGLARVSENGGELKQFTRPDSAQLWHVWPVMLADGRTIIFSIWNQRDRTLRNSHLAITSLDDSTVHPLGVQAARALGVSGDNLVYLTGDGTVMATRIDLRQHRALGSPVTLIDSIPMCASCNGDAPVTLSSSGALTYMRGIVRGRLVWMTPDHIEEGVGKVGLVAPMITPRLSPNGGQVAMEITGDQHRDIWIFDIASGNLNKLTSGGDNSSPEWMDDGKSIMFLSTRDGSTGVWRQALDNSREPERVLTGISSQGWAVSPAPDRRHLMLDANNGAAVNLIVASIGADTASSPFVSGMFNAWGGRFSPSGKWVAYVSDESGKPEVYIKPFPGPGGRVHISTAGGMEPLWSRDGRAVYYSAGTQLMVARLSPEPAVAVTSHDSLFAWPFAGIYFNTATYDVAPDGRILMIKPSEDRYQLVVTLHWATALAARLGKP